LKDYLQKLPQKALIWIHSWGANHSAAERLSAEDLLQIVNQFGLDLLEHSTLDDILWSIANSAISRLGFVDCVIYLVTPDGRNLQQRAAYGPKNPVGKVIKDPILIPVGEGIVGAAFSQRRSQIVSDTSIDSRYILDDENRLSELAVPIIYGDTCIGVIDSEHPDRDFYTEDMEKLIYTIASMASARISDALNSLQLSEALEREQRHLMEMESQLAELVSAKEAAEEALQVRSNFMAMMSHEMKTPLNAIIGLTDILLEEEFEEASKSTLKVVNRSGHQGLAKLNQIFEFLNLEKKGIELDVDAVDLNQLLKELSAVSGMNQERPGLGYKYSVSSDLNAEVMLDRQRVRQVILNLIDNARKSTDRGVIEIVVSLVGVAEAAQIEFQVKDTGEGIPETELPLLFEPFRQIDEGASRKFGGLGLGLSICRKLVLLMKGSIDVTSEIGEGTTVSFRLPLVYADNLGAREVILRQDSRSGG